MQRHDRQYKQSPEPDALPPCCGDDVHRCHAATAGLQTAWKLRSRLPFFLACRSVQRSMDASPPAMANASVCGQRQVSRAMRLASCIRRHMVSQLSQGWETLMLECDGVGAGKKLERVVSAGYDRSCVVKTQQPPQARISFPPVGQTKLRRAKQR